MPKKTRTEEDFRELRAHLTEARNALLTAEVKAGNMYPKQPGKEMKRIAKIREAVDAYRWELENQSGREEVRMRTSAQAGS